VLRLLIRSMPLAADVELALLAEGMRCAAPTLTHKVVTALTIPRC